MSFALPPAHSPATHPARAVLQRPRERIQITQQPGFLERSVSSASTRISSRIVSAGTSLKSLFSLSIFATQAGSWCFDQVRFLCATHSLLAAHLPIASSFIVSYFGSRKNGVVGGAYSRKSLGQSRFLVKSVCVCVCVCWCMGVCVFGVIDSGREK